MSKTKTVVPPTVATETVQEAPKAPKVVRVIQVVKDAKKGWKDGQSGDAWFAAVQKCEGMTIAEFTAYCAANPPRLTKSGQLDAPSGWLRYLASERGGRVIVMAERTIAAQ